MGPPRAYANAASGTVANTITSVTLANYGTSSAINDNALTTLSLTGGNANSVATTLTITNAVAAPTNTTLALTLNGLGTTNGLGTAIGTIAATSTKVTTLNVTTAVNDSNIIFTDASLTTLNVAGTNVLNLNTLGGATIATIAVSGAAGFNDNGLLAGEGASLTSFTTTSSGQITATLNDTNQTFTGSTGQDVITITADATKVIKGGSATNNEIVLANTAATFNATAAHLTNANVTGFTTLGVTNASTGPWNMNSLNTGFNSIDVMATSLTATFNKVATGSSIALDATNSGIITVNYVDATGVSDTTALTIGAAPTAGVTSTNQTQTGLALADANGVGIGTVNVTSNGADVGQLAATGGAFNTITTLTDQGLSHLNVTGGAGLTITNLLETATQATAITIASNETGVNGTTITNLTDANLGTLTFTGTNATSIGTLTDATSTSLTIVNTGSQAASITGIASTANLTSLTLTGQIEVGPGLVGDAAGIFTTSTAGVTISGGTDNQHVRLSMGAAAAGATDTITLGNGNNSVNDVTTAGTVNVTVGTGSNNLVIGGAAGANTTGLFNINLGAHTLVTGPDFISVT